MNNDLDIAKIEFNLPSEKTNTYNFEQSGQGTNIGLAQNVHNTTVNIMLPVSNGTIATPTFIQKTINMEYFNLFVILGEHLVNLKWPSMALSPKYNNCIMEI